MGFRSDRPRWFVHGLRGARLAARAAALVSVFVRHLSAFFLVLGLFAAFGARAEATFTNVTVTPASGMVDAATGKLSITVSGRVKAIGTADAIRTVTVYYDNQSVQNRQYTVRYTVAERPLNDERSSVSRTHQVTKNGETLHQHQNHAGKYGGEKHVISVALLVRAKLPTESEAKDLLLMLGKNLMGFHPAIENAIDVAWLINQDASAGFPIS